MNACDGAGRRCSSLQWVTLEKPGGTGTEGTGAGTVHLKQSPSSLLPLNVASCAAFGTSAPEHSRSLLMLAVHSRQTRVHLTLDSRHVTKRGCEVKQIPFSAEVDRCTLIIVSECKRTVTL